MRNSKVRRRIAAGKLRLRIRDLRNLGPRSEAMLAKIGIQSVEALRTTGALEAFMRLRRAGVANSLNALWALVGALEPWPEGRDWRDVAAGEERLPLLLAIESRDLARREVLGAAVPDAAASGGTGKSSGRAGPRGNTSPVEAWAPGLPFEEKPGRAPRGLRAGERTQPVRRVRRRPT